MTTGFNSWSDVSAIASKIKEDAQFVALDTSMFESVAGMITIRDNKTGGAVRELYDYTTEGSFQQVAETDDLASQKFTPALLASLTPYEYGMQYFITDKRIESGDELPEEILADASVSMGRQASYNVQSNLIDLFASFTGGTLGTAGGTLSWQNIYDAASIVRVKAKDKMAPITCVLHEYQWNKLAQSASTFASSLTRASNLTDALDKGWYVGTIGGNINIFTITDESKIDSGDDFTAAVFHRKAIMLDRRRTMTVEAERDASRRGTEYNGSMMYAHGLWQPTYGVQLIGDASTPS